jgi:site-specific DNA-methyltransferase (adenine-specific)
MSLPAPYFERDGIVLYHGDARELLPGMRVDVVLTDPPYGIKKCEWDTEFSAWIFEAAGKVTPILGVMPGLRNLLACPKRAGHLEYRWCLSAHLVNGMTRGAIGYGNWIACVVYSEPGKSLHQRLSDARRCVVGTEPKMPHPCPKPASAVRFFLSCLPGQSVLDPFAGSGTTLLAAMEEGRRAIGIEIEERYCEIAAKRLEQGVLPLERNP